MAKSFLHSRTQQPARVSLRQGYRRKICPYCNSKNEASLNQSKFCLSKFPGGRGRWPGHAISKCQCPKALQSGISRLPPTLHYFYLVPRTECGQECQTLLTHGYPEAVHIQSPPSHPVLCRCGWQGCRTPESHKTLLRISFPEG